MYGLEEKAARQGGSRMRIGSFITARNDMDDLFQRFFGSDPGARPMWQAAGYDVPTDVFHTEDELVVRLDLPEVNPDEIEVTMQENVLLINGARKFPYDPDKVRFLRRGTFYGDFTQRVALGKGLDAERISAHYESGVLELRIPYAAEIQPKKIAIEVGKDKKALN
jgi:HSP20 family protein